MKTITFGTVRTCDR